MFVSTPLVIFILTAVGRVVSDTVNYKKGGVAVLSPGSVSGPITTVTWKHGADIAVELYGQDMTAYRDFNGRCKLNTTTGALTISNLSLKDSGSYTAEVNNKIMKTTEIKVITAVPKPTISTHCYPEETRCALTCEANVTEDMGTVTYSWMIGDRQIPESSSSQLNILKGDTEFVGKPISCQLENPVSRERSDVIMSPFRNESSGGVITLAVVIPLIVLVVLVALVALIHYLFWRKNRPEDKNAGCRQYVAWLRTRLCLNCGRTDQETAGQTQQNQRAEMEVLISQNANGSASSPQNQTVSTQDQPGPEYTDTNNGDATRPQNQTVKNQDQPGPEHTDTKKEDASIPQNQTVSTQDQPGPEHIYINSEAETSAEGPNAEEPPHHPHQQEDETTKV